MPIPTRPPRTASTPRARRIATRLIRLAALSAILAHAEAGAQAAAARPGVLRLTPAIPRAGQPVQVSYDASPALAGKKALVLRAAVFGGAGAARDLPALTLAALAPAAGGQYRGQFTAPSNATLLRMAVETESGDATDRNGDVYFDAVFAAADGRPNYDGLWWSGLWARVRLASTGPAGGPTVAALRARVDSVARLYPERAGGWRLRALAAGAPDEAERTERVKRVTALDQGLAKASAPNLADANELANLADDLGLEPIANRWHDRIIADSLRTDPVSRNVWYLEASRRGVMAMAKGEPTALLARAVGQWQPGVATTLNLRLTESGARLALAAGDTIRARVWYDRCGPACLLSFPPAPKGAALAFLVGRVKRLRAAPIIGTERPLGVTLAEAGAVDTNVRARLVAAQAQLLAASGRATDAQQAQTDLKALAPDGLGRAPAVAGLVFSARAHLAMVPRTR